MRKTTTTAIALLLVAGSILSSASAGAQAKPDPREEQKRVREERADVAAQVNVLTADQVTIQNALADLAANVQSQQQALATAEVELTEAEQRSVQAADKVETAEEHLAGLHLELEDAAIEAYVAPQGNPNDFLIGSGSLSDAAKRRALSKMQAVDTSDVIDRVRAARAELNARRQEAEQAKTEAESKRDDAATQLEEVQAAEQQQQDFAAQVRTRLDASTARSIELAKTDRKLSTQIALEDAAIAARLREAELARQRERERLARQRLEQAQAAEAAREREQAAQEEAQEEAAQRPPPTTRPPAPAPPAPDPEPADPEPTDTSPQPGGSSGGIPLCSAGGITVNCQIVDSVSRMLAAAQSDGVNLSGGGYRDPAQQIELRKAHCGTSYYAIYLMPASQCSPPTAPPGSSMHEVGLAIDFNNCSSRSTACYQWMNANASQFGFYNLPSEPWHWSINGG